MKSWKRAWRCAIPSWIAILAVLASGCAAEGESEREVHALPKTLCETRIERQVFKDLLPKPKDSPIVYTGAYGKLSELDSIWEGGCRITVNRVHDLDIKSYVTVEDLPNRKGFANLAFQAPRARWVKQGDVQGFAAPNRSYIWVPCATAEYSFLHFVVRVESRSLDKQGSRRLARVSGRVATAVASYLSEDVMRCKNNPEIPASPHLGELVR